MNTFRYSATRLTGDNRDLQPLMPAVELLYSSGWIDNDAESRDNMDNFLQKNDCILVCAAEPDSDQPIGIAVVDLQIESGQAEIMHVIVHEEHQSQRVGTTLVRLI